jgi:hypothetical protein
VLQAQLRGFMQSSKSELEQQAEVHPQAFFPIVVVV